MSQSKLSEATRKLIKAAEISRQRRIGVIGSAGKFTRMPAHQSFSTRGERGQTWRTKAHTASRLKDLAEHQKLRAKAA